MSLRERITNVDELRSWKDKIPFHYEYTAGVAGETFLRGLQDGKILVARCGRCGKSYLPPKMYCVDDFSEIKSFNELKTEGRVSAMAESHVDFEGRRLKAEKVFVFVTFKGIEGGLIHHGVGRGLKVGTKVAPKFKSASKRRGTLMDIQGFARA